LRGTIGIGYSATELADNVPQTIKHLLL
jgi:hypothetical protein